MGNWVSINGKWHPANEKIGLIDHEGKEGREPGDPYVYEGPDRQASFELYQAGVKNFGQDFRHDAEFIHRVKQLGFKDMAEYLEYVGFDEKKEKEEAEKKLAKKVKYEVPKTGKMIEKLGGGIDTSGNGQDKMGGFDLPKELG